jgi:cytochrome c-type biogenesis protein CcmH
MTIWLFALLLTAVACSMLYFAGARRTVNATTAAVDASRAHFRAQLDSIDADLANGRLGAAEATAARAELAREAARETGLSVPAGGKTPMVWFALLVVAAGSLGTYAFIGSPDAPAMPLAERDLEAEAAGSLEQAVAAIESRLAAGPDDVRGWTVIAPVYMQLGRYADAERALRRVIELATPTPDTLTDLAEALMMQAGGLLAGEPMDLLRRANQMDPTHVRSLFYIAGEETRAGAYEDATRDWNALLALAEGSEPWVVTARDGLAFAEAAINPEAAPPEPDQAQIDAMVDGLASRLEREGGTIGEWTQLVRSRMLQGRMDEAQQAYDAARKAFPSADERTELDVLAADNGLVAR